MYWDIQAKKNSVELDKMSQNVASDQDLHCVPFIQVYYRHINR